MKYYKTPAQEQSVTKATNAELINWVYNRKMTALKLHNYFREVLCWLGLESLAKMQKCRFMSEYEDLIHISSHMRNTTGMMPNVEGPKDVLDVDTFKLGGKAQLEQLSKADKEKILRRIIVDWSDWEHETVDMLGDLAIVFRSRTEIPTALFLEELLEDTFEEAQTAKDINAMLQGVNYNLETVFVIQNKVGSRDTKED